MIEINYTVPKNDRSHERGYGKHCFIYRGQEVQEIAKKYGREKQKKLCLKIFDRCQNIDKWGDDPLTEEHAVRNTILGEATIVQNLCSIFGLAPRVYALEKIKFNGKEVMAQLTQDLGNPAPPEFKLAVIDHSKAIKLYEKIKKLGEQFGFKTNYDDVSCYDEIDGRLVDFQSFYLTDDFDDKIRKFYAEHTKWGKVYYQQENEMGMLAGPRRLKDRIKALKLDRFNFKNRSVLDLGCNGGQIMRWIARHGGNQICGYDLSDVVKGAAVMSYALRYENLEFFDTDLDKYTWLPNTKYDVVLYLSMIRHTGLPDWLPKIAKEMVIIEWNNGVTVQELEDWMTKNFASWEKVGESADHGNKPCYWCIPKK